MPRAVENFLQVVVGEPHLTTQAAMWDGAPLHMLLEPAHADIEALRGFLIGVQQRVANMGSHGFSTGRRDRPELASAAE